MSICHSELVSESWNFYHPTLTLPVQGGKKAFTLAEVLITLVIIGVIAAITVPTMMNNKRNEELRAGLLKAQSTLAGALEMYYVNNGERLTVSNIQGWQLKSILMKYISSAKDCGIGTESSMSACVPNTNSSTPTYKTLNNNALVHYYFDDGQFIMNNGMTVLLENPNTPNRVYISVDVNGYKKKPNKAGHDLFMFQLDSKGNLLPMGKNGTYFYSATDYYCLQTTNNNTNGFGCTAKALADPNWFKNLH